jgi:hypothetical protein
MGYLVSDLIPLFFFWGYIKEYAYVSELPFHYTGKTWDAAFAVIPPTLINIRTGL